MIVTTTRLKCAVSQKQNKTLAVTSFDCFDDTALFTYALHDDIIPQQTNDYIN